MEKAKHRLACRTLFDMTWATFKAPIHFIISVCFCVSRTIQRFSVKEKASERKAVTERKEGRKCVDWDERETH